MNKKFSDFCFRKSFKLIILCMFVGAAFAAIVSPVCRHDRPHSQLPGEENRGRFSPLQTFDNYVSIGGECRPVLSSDSEILIYEIEINEGDVLFGAIGVVASNDSEKPDKRPVEGSIERLLAPNAHPLNHNAIASDSSVLFRLNVVRDDESRCHLRKTLNPDNNANGRQWFEYEISLDAYAGEVISFQFISENKDENQNDAENGLWTVPVIKSRKPDPGIAQSNFIMICLDTLRSDHLGCYGNPRPLSPEIDRFSRNADCFSRITADSSWTLPSMLSVFTGLTPHRHQTLEAKDPQLMDAPVTFTAELFHDSGCQTAAFTGGGFVSPGWGFARGFQVYNFEGDGAAEVFMRAGKWLKKNSDDPFFLFIHTYEIHAPYNTNTKNRIFTDPDAVQPNPETNDYPGLVKDLIDHYDDGIRYTDKIVGLFLDFLKSEGIYESSGILLFSDHGEEFAEHGGFYHKRTAFRELMEIPLLFKLPHEGSQHRIINTRHVASHIMPTVSRLYNLKSTPGDSPDSCDLFSEFPHSKPLLGFGSSRKKMLVSATAAGKKVIWNAQGDSKVFDIKNDPGENAPLPLHHSPDAAWKKTLEAGTISGQNKFYIWYDNRRQNSPLSLKIESGKPMANPLAFDCEVNVSPLTDIYANKHIASVELSPLGNVSVCGMAFSNANVQIYDLKIGEEPLPADKIIAGFDNVAENSLKDNDKDTFVLNPGHPEFGKAFTFDSEALVWLIGYEKRVEEMPHYIEDKIKAQLEQLGYIYTDNDESRNGNDNLIYQN